jgi:type I restriction enzyme S subunit
MNDSIPTNPTEISVASDWQILSIEGLCERVTSGATPYRSESRYYQGGAIQWFKTKELGSLRLVDSEEKITDAAIRETSVKLFPPGTVLMAMHGDGKTITSLGILEVEAATNQACCAMIPNTMVCDSRFLYYSLSHYKQDFLQIANGGAQRNLSGALIKNFCVGAPPLEEQKSIAHILGTLDDKIELNRKTNETLEAMAKALFKSWFVDFDPVRAKAEGRPTGLPAEISNLFPDSFEDSELGEIPRGWGVAKIDQIIKIQKDSIDPSVTPDETFDHYSIPAFDSGKNPAKELGSSIKSQKFLVGDDDLLVSKLNPSTPRVWIPFSSSARRSICSTEFLVCRASTDVGRAFAYCLASSDSIIEVMTGLAGGTSNSHQRIRPSDFLSLDCCIGSQKVRSAFSDVVEPLLRKTLAQRIESRSLASARDALLPKLISGEIRIPDAERMLEEVGV